MVSHTDTFMDNELSLKANVLNTPEFFWNLNGFYINLANLTVRWNNVYGGTSF